METEEIVVDHGHLHSLADSALWATDSEKEDSDDILFEQTVVEDTDIQVFTASGECMGQDKPHETLQLPSKEEILKQFGDVYGQEILSYLQNRTSLPSKKQGKGGLWSGPEDEEAIFARAKELWRQNRITNKLKTPNGSARTFDKASFERAVFGAVSEQTFEHVMSGLWENDDGWTDDEDDEGESMGMGRKIRRMSSERRTPSIGDWTPKRRRVETPRKGICVPSSRKSFLGKDKSRGAVISGLIVDESHDDDFWDKINKGSPLVRKKREIPETPQVAEERGRRGTPLTLRRGMTTPSKSTECTTPSTRRSDSSYIIKGEDENEDDDQAILNDGHDTKLRCGDVGYRCTKAFCFKCLS